MTTITRILTIVSLTTMLLVASDYIFYTASRLRALAALDVPARETLERDTALPSNACGSHHILLMSVLESIVDEKE